VRQFQQLIWAALLAGFTAGTILFVYQELAVVPRIVEAEAWEVRDEAAEPEVVRHRPSEWKPSEGFERNFFTAVSTILTGIGYAALMLSIITLGGFVLNVRRGLFWGLAGFACFVVAPAFDLPPLPPGVTVPDLRARQLSWVFTAAATAIGLFLTVPRSRGWISTVAGGLLLLLPHLFGPPRIIQPQTVPADLIRAFSAAVIVGNALFWLVLGALTGFLLDRNRKTEGSGAPSRY